MLGQLLGWFDGNTVGAELGMVGYAVGSLVGSAVGSLVGSGVGDGTATSHSCTEVCVRWKVTNCVWLHNSRGKLNGTRRLASKRRVVRPVSSAKDAGTRPDRAFPRN